jgi:hypothetical protein
MRRYNIDVVVVVVCRLVCLELRRQSHREVPICLVLRRRLRREDKIQFL